LIDAYLRRELSVERRERFERNYLSTPARRERVAHAAALLRFLDERNAESPPPVDLAAVERGFSRRVKNFWLSQAWGLRAAVVFASLALVAGLLWFVVLRAPSTRSYATVILTAAGNNRSGQGSFGRVKLPKGSGLRASLTLPKMVPSTPKYRVELEDDNGEIKQAETVAPEGNLVTIVIPASRLAAGKYVFKLFAVSVDGTEQRVPGSYNLIVE
jgi:methionine-rich copper-binding protein CopC